MTLSARTVRTVAAAAALLVPACARRLDATAPPVLVAARACALSLAVAPPAEPPAPAPAPSPPPSPPAAGASPAPAPTPSPAPAAPPTAPPPAGPTPPTPPALTREEWWAIAVGRDRTPLDCVPRPPVCGWEGDATLRARVRFTADDADVDLYEHLRLRWRREDAQGWSASMHVRASEDLDGGHDGSSFFVFDSVDDTYDTAVQVRLYHLYANRRDEGALVEQVRIGRQDVTATAESFHVDGAHVVLRPAPGGATRLFAYGGVPTHLYDTSHEGDWIVGAGASFEPRCGTSIEVGDTYLEDASGLYGAKSANLASAEWTQRLSALSTARVGYQQLDAQPRRAWGSFDASAPSCDASVRGSLRAQILEEHSEAYDVDPYFAILLDLEPYWEASLSASKGLGCAWSVEAGAQARRLFDDDDRGEFNHDFTRAFVTVSARDRPFRCVGVAFTGEWWRSEDGEDVGAFGFEADWRPAGPLRLTAGIDYALYRTDLFTVSERYDSYGAYVRARYTSPSGWGWSASLRADTDDYDTYWTLDVALRIEF